MEKGKDICFNFNQICRFCLSQGGVMSAIFADSGQGITSLPSKIMSCVSIQMYAGDGLPALICHRCLYQVERSYEFKEQCEHSDATLRQYLRRQQRVGDTCQVVTIKQENIDDSSQDVVENGVDFATDCSTPKDDSIHIKEEIDIQQFADTESSKEKKPSVESVVVAVSPYQMEATGQTGLEILPSEMVTLKEKQCFEQNVVVDKGFKPFLCELCFKSFSDRAYLRTHMQLHTGIRAHRCNLCSKAFARRRELLRHEKVHSGERPFGCSICTKRFSRRDKLTRHEKIHTEQRRHACAVCPATFLRSDELTRHGMCHTGERPWCCPVCYKSFFSKAELNRHSKTHADVKPHKCNLCTMAFCRKDKLTRHQRTHFKKRYGYNSLCNIRNNGLVIETGQKVISDLKQLSSLKFENKSSNQRENNARGNEGEDPDVSLSRLGKNPEILLFPLPQE